jgi:hypothetical protein
MTEQTHNNITNKKLGRPKKVKKETQELVIDWISSGKTLKDFCRKFKIDRKLIYSWIKESPSFALSYEHARQVGCDQIADEIISIIDEPQYIENRTVQQLKDGTTVTKIERVDNWQARRLQAEYRMKLLGKFYPEKYGDAKLEPVTSITYNHILAK